VSSVHPGPNAALAPAPRHWRALLALGLLAAWPAGAWHSEGHRRVAADAVRVLPREIPAFFRAGAVAVGHAAVDPDTWKSPQAPRLRDQESPEHYLDSELLGGRPLPPLRSEYQALLARLELTGSQVGYLPYRIVEATQRLTLAFAEHRRWPRNRHVRAKTIVYAGLLAHYAADLCQPLHTTIHHDGLALPDGSSPRSGVHERVDGLFERVRFDRGTLLRGIAPRRFDDLWSVTTERLERSHALVDRVYELEPAIGGDGSADPEVAAFTRERYRETAAFLASLFWTAWRDSEAIELPDWLVRGDH